MSKQSHPIASQRLITDADSLQLKKLHRKESLQRDSNQIRKLSRELSQKKMLSAYTHSASLETFESVENSRGVVEQLMRRINQLEQQVQNLHRSYNSKIEEMMKQHNQRSDKYLAMIHETHLRHKEELDRFSKIIGQYESQRQQIVAVEEKMDFINASIEDILKQSTEINSRNKELKELLATKDLQIDNLEATISQNIKLMESIQNELKVCRERLNEQEQSLNILQKNKEQWDSMKQEMLRLIQVAEQQIDGGQHCSLTKQNKAQCQHCRIEVIRMRLQNVR